MLTLLDRLFARHRKREAAAIRHKETCEAWAQAINAKNLTDEEAWDSFQSFLTEHNERDIARVMTEMGMGRMQAINHLRGRAAAARSIK